MQTESSKSSGDRLRAAATGKSLTAKEPSSFPQMLNAYRMQIASALPKHMNGDRMARIALTSFRQNPKLGACDPKSVFASVIVGAQLGLEPGIMGQAYLVPYKTKAGMMCQFIPGWQGLVDLVNRSGRASVWTGAVWKGDEFEYEYGSAPRIHHKPSADGADESDPENLLYVYAVGQVKGSDFPVIDVWSNLKVRRHRDRYNKVGDSHYSYENFEMYARKVPLLQVIKYMPKSIELANAVSLSYGADSGQVIGLQDAIDGTFLPAPTVEEQTLPAHEQQTTAAGEEKQAADAEAASIEYLRTAETTAELKSFWAGVQKRYADAGERVPVNVEAARNDRQEALAQAESKKRN